MNSNLHSLLIPILATVTVVPLGALVGKYVTFRVAGFKPRYRAVLLSSILTLVIAYALAIGLRLFADTGQDLNARGLAMAVGLGALTCCHFTLLKSNDGRRLSASQAFWVAICQIIGGAIAGILLMLLVVFGLAILRRIT